MIVEPALSQIELSELLSLDLFPFLSADICTHELQRPRYSFHIFHSSAHVAPNATIKLNILITINLQGSLPSVSFLSLGQNKVPCHTIPKTSGPYHFFQLIHMISCDVIRSCLGRKKDIGMILLFSS